MYIYIYVFCRLLMSDLVVKFHAAIRLSKLPERDANLLSSPSPAAAAVGAHAGVGEGVAGGSS